LTKHFHVSTGSMVSGALMGYIPDPKDPEFKDERAAQEHLKRETDDLQKSLNSQGIEPTVEESPSRVVVTWFFDGYDRGRIFELVPCDNDHAQEPTKQ
jgi:hypothetical protein